MTRTPSFSTALLLPFQFALSPRRLAIFALLYLSVSACYLNSCPYLRTSKTDKCGMCGKTGDGVCVAEGVCCTADECKEDKSCNDVEHCPLPYCDINGENGFCASATLCCSEKFCQRTMQCLNSMTKKVKKLRFRRRA